MTKVGVITIHYGNNYGSALQAYALQEYLKNRGDDVVLLNYLPERYLVDCNHIINKKNEFIIKEFIYRILTYRKKKKCLKTFELFLTSHIKISKKLYNSDDLYKIANDCNIVIVGSDQVWNSDYNDGIDLNYYLSFVPKGIKKIAYAASCGKDDYTPKEWLQIKELLSDFDAISLRESDMVKRFREIGINSSLVCDPVFLLTPKEWEKIMVCTNQIENDYLLIYCLESNKKELIDLGNKIAKQRGLKTVIVSYYSIRHSRDVDYNLEVSNPSVFISLVSNSSYVITNSFHGVAFSIIFNKQFLVLKRNKYNSRITSLLKRFDIMDRYIDLDEKLVFQNDIDYQNINVLKQTFINESKDFLNKVIEEDE